MVHLKKGFFLVFLLSFLMTACSIQNQPTTESVQSSPTPQSPKGVTSSEQEQGYPAQENALPTQSYPVPPTDDPLSPYPEKIEVPAPGDGMGVVTGQVLEISNNEPYLAPSLILGQLVFGSDASAPPLVGYSPETDPVAVIDRAGRFVFKDVKPGKYAIVVWTPGSQTLISDKQGNTLQIVVEPDKTIDLGKVYVP